MSMMNEFFPPFKEMIAHIIGKTFFNYSSALARPLTTSHTAPRFALAGSMEVIAPLRTLRPLVRRDCRFGFLTNLGLALDRIEAAGSAGGLFAP